jgi:hypothetical protein
MHTRSRWRRLAVVVTTAGMLAATGALPASAARDYPNCTALNRDHPHGVGKPGAVDKVRAGSPRVTNFTRSRPLYRANKESDRDGDKIACERL